MLHPRITLALSQMETNEKDAEMICGMNFILFSMKHKRKKKKHLGHQEGD